MPGSLTGPLPNISCDKTVSVTGDWPLVYKPQLIHFLRTPS